MLTHMLLLLMLVTQAHPRILRGLGTADASIQMDHSLEASVQGIKGDGSLDLPCVTQSKQTVAFLIRAFMDSSVGAACASAFSVVVRFFHMNHHCAAWTRNDRE